MTKKKHTNPVPPPLPKTSARVSNTSLKKSSRRACRCGWEVKSLRAGKANLSDSYVTFRDGEAYLFGATITPLNVASSHVVCDPTRTRKLLLNRRELDTLLGRVNRDGYTVVALSLYWKNAGARSRSA